MKKLPVIFLFLLFNFGTGHALLAQTEADFQGFASRLFTYLTDTSASRPIEYVRIQTLHDLIDQQNLSAREKEARHAKAEEEYLRNYEIYHQQMDRMLKQKDKEVRLGSEYEILNFSYEAYAENLYQGQIRFLYKSGATQSLATYKFRFFYNGRGFGLMGPVEEEY